MREYHISVSKQARYFTYGELNENTTDIWYLIHGYGQTANNFLKDFGSLSNDTNLLIAPEGLSRFYWDGFSGKPVASWMTSIDREREIQDYVTYLDNLYERILDDCAGLGIEVNFNLVGFSQGVATVSRWVCIGREKQFKQLLLIAGEMGRELDLSNPALPLFQSKLHYLYGDKDPFLQQAAVKLYQAKLNQAAKPFETHVFEGAHEINLDCIQLIKSIVKTEL